jgi:hypothetical protein
MTTADGVGWGGRRKTAGEAAGGKQGWNGGRKTRKGKQEGILIGG